VSALIGQISTLSSVYHKTPEEIALMQKKAIAGGVATVTPINTPIAKNEEDKKESSVESKKTTKDRGERGDTKEENKKTHNKKVESSDDEA
jgi:hypothetical protein